MKRRRLISLLTRIALYASAAVAILVVAGIVFFFATLYRAGAAQAGYLALVGATVLAGEDLEPLGNGTVLIREGAIIQVGDAEDVDVPPEATVLDLSGYTLMPGLIDLHVHLGSSELEAGERPGPMMFPRLVVDWMRFFPGRRRALLEHGVTTVRSLGDETEWVLEFRQLIRDGELEGPNIFAAGPIFTTPGGHPVATFGVEPDSDVVRLPSTAEAARTAVRELAGGDRGVDLIKVVQERGRPEYPLEPIRPEVLRAIVSEAHAHGLPVVAHWGTLEDLEDVLDAGVDGLQHLEPRGVLEGWPPRVLDELVGRDMPLSPTLAVVEVVIPPEIVRQLQRRVGEYRAAGGRVTVGSDSGMPGVPFGAGVHRELELLVDRGLTTRDALKGATSEAAKALRSDRIGAIAPGRAADLVAVAGDPLREIAAVRSVAMVFRDGRLVVDRRRR